MTDRSQFGAHKPQPEAGQLECATVELWLADAAEGALAPDAAEQLQRHAALCPVCNQQLAQARRGREWLLVLKQEELEPPADLVFKILAKTMGSSLPAAPDAAHPAGAGGADSISASGPLDAAWQHDSIPASMHGSIHGSMHGSIHGSMHGSIHGSMVVLRRTLLDPRLSLVAAMAFFSITLTLNLLGVRLSSIHPADLQPYNLRRAVTRQYAEANARVARYYENLKIVYEVESRVQQLRRAAASAPAARQSSPKSSNGGSSDSSSGQKDEHPARLVAAPGSKHSQPTAPIQPEPAFTGPVVEAAWRAQTFLASPRRALHTIDKSATRERGLA